MKLKIAIYHLLAAFLLPALAAGQTAESRVTFDISAAEALIETFEAMQQENQKIRLTALLMGCLPYMPTLLAPSDLVRKIKFRRLRSESISVS